MRAPTPARRRLLALPLLFTALDQVGASLAGERGGLLAAPGGNAGVVAGKKERRDQSAFPFRRPCVVRIFEKAVDETLGRGGLGVAHDPWQETNNRIEDD